MKFIHCLLILMLIAGSAHSAHPGVSHWESGQDIETVYNSVYKALEDKRFYVVFEPDIGANLARSAERWGENYNRNGLTAIRAMVFCNGWYANAVSNLDPEMLALCPLHITLYEQQGKTHVVFLRPGVVSEGSRAHGLLVEVERTVSEAIESGITSTNH